MSDISDIENSGCNNDYSIIKHIHQKFTRSIISNDFDSDNNNDSKEEDTQEFFEIDEAPII